MLLLTIAVASAVQFRLETRFDSTYLVLGKEKVNLTRPTAGEVVFADGKRLFFEHSRSRGGETALLVQSERRLINFSEQIGVWVADDNLWGRKRANDLRYTNSRLQGNRGISGDISEAFSLDGKTALCILNLRMAFASAVPVIEQLLVKLDPNDAAHPVLLQILPGDSYGSEMGSQAAKRFIRWNNRTFLYMDTRYVAIKRDGQLDTQYIPAPEGTPLQQIGSQHLLLFRRGEPNGYDIFDLKKRKAFPLLRGTAGPHPTYVYVNPSAPSQWLIAGDGSHKGSRQFLIRVPDGKRLSSPVRADLVWKNYAIGSSYPNDVEVFELPSGKHLASLKRSRQ